MLDILNRNRVAELEKELATYKHAYETTRDDRDRWKQITMEAADPLDAGFFRLDFARLKNRDRRQSDDLAKEWESLYASGEHDKLILAILESSRVRIAHPTEPNALKSLATYYLANFHAQRGRYESAARYAAEIEFTAPPDGADFLPYDLRQGTRLAMYQQREAIERDEPGIIIVSLRKSASAHLSSAIAQALRLPVLRIGVGEGQHSVAVPRWAMQVAEGGAITHDHMQALPGNVAALSSVGRIWVQVRDPRDAAWSLMNMARAPGEWATKPNTAPSFLKDCREMADWIAGWVSAASELDIAFIDYANVTQSAIETVTRMVGDERAERVAPFLFQRGSNFRSGKAAQWRSAFPADTCAEADALIAPDLASRFSWPLQGCQ